MFNEELKNTIGYKKVKELTNEQITNFIKDRLKDWDLQTSIIETIANEKKDSYRVLLLVFNDDCFTRISFASKTAEELTLNEIVQFVIQSVTHYRNNKRYNAHVKGI